MRRLAQELDVWPMSVYRYFRDKDALLDAMAAEATGGIAGETGGGPWRDELHALLAGAARSIAAAPGLAGRLPRALVDPAGLRLPEAGVAVLLGAGFDEAAAAGAWRALWSYTFGFATFRVESERALRGAMAGLAEEEFPALAVAGAQVAAAFTGQDDFAAGLDALLDGLEQRLSGGPGSPRPAGTSVG